MEIESRTPLSPTAVLTHLQDLEELNDVQRDTLEHLNGRLTVQDMDAFEELQAEAEELDSFREEHIIKIIDTLPRSEQEVRTLFSKERVKLADGEVEAVAEFAASVGT